MKVIHKYPLKQNFKIRRGRFEVTMPLGACILSAGVDDIGDLCVWACHDMDEGWNEMRVFRVFATGEFIDAPPISFVGTVIEYGFVWHVFVEDANHTIEETK